MKEYPEARDTINKFLLTEGKLTWSEITQMANIDYQCFIVCSNALAVAKEIGAFKARSRLGAYNKQAYQQRLGVSEE